MNSVHDKVYDTMYVKKIKIISGSSQENVENGVNDFLFSIAKEAKDIKIHCQFSSSESFSEFSGHSSTTTYVYTIEYMVYVDNNVDKKEPHQLAGLGKFY